jgi:hypothetical protein
MNRRELLKRIERQAKARGLEVHLQELSRHSGITVGGTSTTIPRHTEIANRMAEVIFKQLEHELGKGWWR